MFSSRIPGDVTTNQLTAALQARRRDGQRLIDLSLSNPTRADLPYPAELLAPLADARGLDYRPQALGVI